MAYSLNVSLQAVYFLKLGYSPKHAAEFALASIRAHVKKFQGALIVIDAQGEVGAAAHGWTFSYSYQNSNMNEPKVVTVTPCTESDCPGTSLEDLR